MVAPVVTTISTIKRRFKKFNGFSKFLQMSVFTTKSPTFVIKKGNKYLYDHNLSTKYWDNHN
jgi:hypothetical protein